MIETGRDGPKVPIPNKFTYRHEPNTGNMLPQSEWRIVTLPDDSDKETEYWFDHLRINQKNWEAFHRIGVDPLNNLRGILI
jgi:hypothetical protein